MSSKTFVVEVEGVLPVLFCAWLEVVFLVLTG